MNTCILLSRRARRASSRNQSAVLPVFRDLVLPFSLSPSLFLSVCSLKRVENFEYKFRRNSLVTPSSRNRYRTLHARNAEVLWRRSAISAALARFHCLLPTHPPTLFRFRASALAPYQLFIRSDFSLRVDCSAHESRKPLKFHRVELLEISREFLEQLPPPSNPPFTFMCQSCFFLINLKLNFQLLI